MSDVDETITPEVAGSIHVDLMSNGDIEFSIRGAVNPFHLFGAAGQLRVIGEQMYVQGQIEQAQKSGVVVARNIPHVRNSRTL